MSIEIWVGLGRGEGDGVYSLFFGDGCVYVVFRFGKIEEVIVIINVMIIIFYIGLGRLF